ncbi:hypothetical protein SAMN02910358_01654 [Lachnospiraceae bacterium XBB1006]|nr:hypothetical protein SAMN02910358_01654 [Lachnospiraceae bacterium XBB1006]
MRNISEYIRHVILYNYTYDCDYNEFREYNRQLSAIGRNLNMIRERMMKSGTVYEEDVKEIKELCNPDKTEEQLTRIVDTLIITLFSAPLIISTIKNTTITRKAIIISDISAMNYAKYIKFTAPVAGTTCAW